MRVSSGIVIALIAAGSASAISSSAAASLLNRDLIDAKMPQYCGIGVCQIKAEDGRDMTEIKYLPKAGYTLEQAEGRFPESGPSTFI
jgi:hypothetical protein